MASPKIARRASHQGLADEVESSTSDPPPIDLSPVISQAGHALSNQCTEPRPVGYQSFIPPQRRRRIVRSPSDQLLHLFASSTVVLPFHYEALTWQPCQQPALSPHIR